jgi:hypothetical protein
MKNKTNAFVSLEKAINKWKKDNELESAEDLAKVVESLLVYSVVLVAKTKQVGFELAGDVSGGDEETYVFDFTVNKQQKRIPEPNEIN